MIIEKAAPYKSGGVTTLMSVGNGLDDFLSSQNKLTKAAIFSTIGYLGGMFLESSSGRKSKMKYLLAAAFGAASLII